MAKTVRKRNDRSRFEVTPDGDRFTWTLYDKYGRVRTRARTSFSRVNNTRRDALRVRKEKGLGKRVPIVNVL